MGLGCSNSVKNNRAQVVSILCYLLVVRTEPDLLEINNFTWLWSTEFEQPTPP